MLHMYTNIVSASMPTLPLLLPSLTWVEAGTACDSRMWGPLVSLVSCNVQTRIPHFVDNIDICTCLEWAEVQRGI